MRTYPQIPTFFLILWIGAGSALPATVSDPTAKKALRRLPNSEAQRLARIVAIGGTPVPESWHILSHDPGSETGIRERVVADGAISESAETSAHADYLTEDDIIGRRAVKTDTDRIFSMANQYALENDLLVTSMNYTLEKNALGEAVWKVDCLGENGAVVGALVIAAETGEVLARDGFPVEPTLAKVNKAKKRSGSALKLDTDAEQMVGGDAAEVDDEAYESAETDGTRDREEVRSAAGKKSGRSHGSRSTRRARRTDPEDVARAVTRPVRRVLRRVLPF